MSNDSRIAGETPTPQTLADDGDALLARCTVSLHPKRASARRPDSKCGEIIARHQLPENSTDRFPIPEIEIAAALGKKRRENRRLFGQVAVVRI